MVATTTGMGNRFETALLSSGASGGHVDRSNAIQLDGFHFHCTSIGPFEHTTCEHVSDHHVLFVTFDGGTDTSILTGDGFGRCEQRDFPGAASFIPAGRLHRSVLIRGRLVCGYVAFADSFVEAACGRRVQSWATGFNAASPRLVRQVATLSRAGERRGVIARATLDALAVAIVRSIATTFAGLPLRKDDARLRPAALMRVLDLIEGRLHENPSLAELASAASLSISGFSRAFRGSLGETPGQYIQRRRMARAREMLLNSQLSASDIARELGFADRAHFANSFRRANGCSPGQFRDDAPLASDSHRTPDIQVRESLEGVTPATES